MDYVMRLSHAGVRAFTAAVVVTVGASIVVACGGADEQARAGQSNALAAKRVTVYFLTDGVAAPLGLRRSLDHGVGTADGAIRELLEGPTADEQRRGLTSAFSSGTELQSLEIRETSPEALVELDGLTPPASAVQRVRMITQVARTLIGVQGIQRVRIRVDGEPLALWTQTGELDDRAYDYDALIGFFGVCIGTAGAEATPGDCFSALP